MNEDHWSGVQPALTFGDFSFNEGVLGFWATGWLGEWECLRWNSRLVFAAAANSSGIFADSQLHSSMGHEMVGIVIDFEGGEGFSVVGSSLVLLIVPPMMLRVVTLQHRKNSL